MAIVKATYTKSRKKIKASVRYIQHRPGLDGERRKRTLFGLDGPLNRQEVYTLVDQATKGTTFFRLVISPDPRREDTERDLNLRQITEQTLLQLSKELGQQVHYAGVIHDDHAPHRHVHVIALVKGKLTREHFRLLRGAATEAALVQRQERDLARGISRGSRAAGSQPPPGGGGSWSKITRCGICGLENCLLHDDVLQLEQ